MTSNEIDKVFIYLLAKSHKLKITKNHSQKAWPKSMAQKLDQKSKAEKHGRKALQKIDLKGSDEV